MPYPLGDWLVERRYAVEIGLQRRQDPVSSSPESTPADTETQSSAPETSAAPPTSSEAPTSSAPTSPTSTPIPSSPTAPSQSATLPTVSETSSAPTPTDPDQSSSLSSRSTVSQASTRSVVSSLSNAGSSPVVTQIITSFIGTNSAGQSVVTVSVTSNYAVPTVAPSKSSQNVGAIVGGVVGGVGGLLILMLLLLFIRRKTKKDKFEDNMFEPDRNIDRPLDLVEGDDVNDPEAIARPYHLPPSPTRPEMGMVANSRPMSMESAFQGRPLSSDTHDALSVPRPTSGGSFYTPPNPGMTMPVPMPMPLSRDHLAHMQSRANSTADYHSQPTSEAMSDGGSSSARALKEREARRLHVANDDGGVVVHSDAGRVNDPDDDEPPREIPPTYESIGGPSGPR
ncbi:hypothetical protein RhiLY_13950 [Ceratobasidium sp. AG-Ba]|nr:hypothetical protein RhiLY_13950 [Ceratobasidium sp. AG-Ba]